MAPISKAVQHSYQKALDFPQNLIEPDDFEHNLKNDSKKLAQESTRLFVSEKDLEVGSAVDMTESCVRVEGITCWNNLCSNLRVIKLKSVDYQSDIIRSTNQLTQKLMNGYEEAVKDPAIRIL